MCDRMQMYNMMFSLLCSGFCLDIIIGRADSQSRFSCTEHLSVCQGKWHVQTGFLFHLQNLKVAGVTVDVVGIEENVDCRSGYQCPLIYNIYITAWSQSEETCGIFSDRYLKQYCEWNGVSRLSAFEKMNTSSEIVWIYPERTGNMKAYGSCRVHSYKYLYFIFTRDICFFKAFSSTRQYLNYLCGLIQWNLTEVSK
jgi:hypothetical protein